MFARLNRGYLCCAALMAALAQSGSFAQDSVRTRYLHGHTPETMAPLATLDSELMGDRISLFNGALEFAHTDASIPGNSALPVAIHRKLAIERNPFVQREFGDWSLEVPRIEGVFAIRDGWKTSAGTLARCSNFSAPPLTDTTVAFPGDIEQWGNQSAPAPSGKQPADGPSVVIRRVYWAPNEFWQGTFLNVPGVGAQEVLKRNAADNFAPQDTLAYPLVTRDRWQLHCLPSVKNGAGEGFVAVSPEGVRYQLDWMETLRERHLQAEGIPGMANAILLGRVRVVLKATKVTDRFGTEVRYVYDGTSKLQRIESSDGRTLWLGYDGQGRIAHVNDGLRTWTYAYATTGELSAVTLPDQTQWTFGLRGLTYQAPWELGENANCEFHGGWPEGELSGWLRHPSGATGTFFTRYIVHGRSNVTKYCVNKTGLRADPTFPMWPKQIVQQSIVRKQISGPAIPDYLWRYEYGIGVYGWAPCANCADTKTVTVTDPGGTVTRHTFGVRFRVNEGQLLKTEAGWDGTTALRTTELRYRASGPWPEPAGISVSQTTDWLSARHRPVDQRVVTQQGVAFRWLAADGAEGFTHHPKPRKVTMRSEPLGHARTHTTLYHDNSAKWVIGQVASVTDDRNRVIESTEHHPVFAVPARVSRYGLEKERIEYHGDGTVHRRINAAGRATTFTDYFRGLPRHVQYADGTAETADVNGFGKITRHTNEYGTTHRYEYDGMGRLRRVDYPPEPNLTYHPTTITYEQQSAPEHGLPAGHWRQRIQTGNAHLYRWFDALWRVRLEQRWAADDGAGGGNSSRMVEFRYDHAGHKTFETTPQRSNVPIDRPIARSNFAQIPAGHTYGTEWVYDGLGREVLRSQASELGLLNTTTAYEDGFRRRVTNPRGFATVYTLRAFDDPDDSHIVGIDAPETAWTRIDRDIDGQPDRIVRGGSGVQPVTRSYVYDAHRRLCKTIEPEAGATVQGYDLAGNLEWRAPGLALPDLACDQGAVPGARRIDYRYDLRDRLLTTTYGDNGQAITRSYWPDGLLQQIVTSGGGTNTIAWTYTYNNRRLLAGERYTWGDPNNAWQFDWSVDPHGNVSGLSDLWGFMAYTPDAWGAPRTVGTYARDIVFHPSGQLAAYTLGNGIAFGMWQNIRGLPELWDHAGVVRDRYAYDANGNVTSITDERHGVHRSMPWYDGLDRLRQANGPWGSGSYAYDAIDNLVSSTVGARSLTHGYDTSNRLTSITGSLNVTINYDLNGNVENRNGQSYRFDLGNRLRQVPGRASYAYDGHGRRNLIGYADGSYAHQAYTMDGKLRLSWKLGPWHKRHVYLGDRLIAETAADGVTTYSHTDALGSPVVRTDAARGEVSRTRYEPYGATVGGTHNPNGIGFTGHVNDPDTGLVYMQQRYYEPLAARFLSVDPVVTDTSTGEQFGRYVYANNNPYKFVDPDGRFAHRGNHGDRGDCRHDAGQCATRGPLLSRPGALFHTDGDAGSPESNRQGLSSTSGDRLGAWALAGMVGVPTLVSGGPLIASAAFSTAPNSLVLWSGFLTSPNLSALGVAGVTFAGTPGGKAANLLAMLFPQGGAAQHFIFQKASAMLASHASGTVTLLLPKGATLGSHVQTELAVIANNPAVRGVTTKIVEGSK